MEQYVITISRQFGSMGRSIARGTFFGDTHRITNLAPGAYALSVSQGGGNEIRSSTSSEIM